MGLTGEWLGNRNSAQGRESGQGRDSFGKPEDRIAESTRAVKSFLSTVRMAFVSRRKEIA
jgi:hypothetical protein